MSDLVDQLEKQIAGLKKSLRIQLERRAAERAEHTRQIEFLRLEGERMVEEHAKETARLRVKITDISLSIIIYSTLRQRISDLESQLQDERSDP
jgi:hypothetical protein